MNIFYLDEDPKICAQYHCDKHLIKMILESCQLLCTAHWMTGGEAPYKKTHFNHPSNKWARESLSNYVWLCDLGMELCKEYTHRYGRLHLTQEKLEHLLKYAPKNIPFASEADVKGLPLAMPDDVKGESVVNSYRRYYNKYKIDFAKYTNREEPTWLLRTGT